MRKKLLFSVLALFVFSVFTISVNAAGATVLSIPYLTESKAPTKVPKDGAKRRVTLTETFDFSPVEFETADGGSLSGGDEMQKIIVFNADPLTELVMTNEGKPGILDTASFGDPEKLFKDWYTAYCLDASKQYPMYGLYNNVDITTYGTAFNTFKTAYQAYGAAVQAYQGEQSTANLEAMNAAGTAADMAAYPILNRMVRAAFVNNPDMQTYIGGKQIVELDSNNGNGTPYYTIGGGKTAKEIVYGISTNPTEDITVTVGTIKVSNSLAEPATSVDVNKDITFTAIDGTFDKYLVTDDVASKYASALWILEHSYPTLTLQRSFDLANVDADALKAEVSTLSGVTDEAALAKTVEGYVYATIQYAVWKTVGAEVDGKVLGPSIKNATELDKLYRYLTKDDHSNYGKNTDVSTKVSISGDTEKYKKTNDGYKFGPFTASYKAIDGGDITLSLADGIEDVKITNGNGTEIDRVPSGGEFYIESSKTAKIGSIKVNARAEITTFDPLSNRAKIYNPVFGAYQNAITGGVYAEKVINGSVDVLVNAKTGVENAAVLLMVTLVAFSLGYLVLSYKGKPVELS